MNLEDIGVGKGKLTFDKDGKPSAYNIYGASNADKNFVKKFTTQAQIAQQQQQAEDEILKKKALKGSQARWFGKMNFSLPYMQEFQRQKNTILVLNPDLQAEIPFCTRLRRASMEFFKECILNWWTFIWLVLNVLSFSFFIGCLILRPAKVPPL